MIISEPNSGHIPELRQLWKAAFGDGDDFLDMFYSTAYAPWRCRCVLDEDQVTAVLYWFDCTCEGQKLAYIYAVATDPRYRNQGLCRRLMDNTAAHLKNLGYAGAMLLPQSVGLRQMYSKMGYVPCTDIGEITCAAAGEPLELTELTAETYAALRKTTLPPGSVIQEGENLSYLTGFAKFYQGPDFLAVAIREEDHAICYEFLGDLTKAPSFLQTLRVKNGAIRHPGHEIPFAMYTPFVPNCPNPEYFAFAFD